MDNIEFLREVFKKYNLTENDYFKSSKFVIITRSGIEKIQNQEGIKVAYKVLRADKDCVMLKAHGEMVERTNENLLVRILKVTTFASATDQNCTSKHYLEVAEKRALARIVLKLLKIYQEGVFGEDEGVHLEDQSAEGWQLTMIESLLRTSTFDHDRQDHIERSLGMYSKKEANDLIKVLKVSQIDPVSEGNFSQGDILVKTMEIIKDPKK